MPCRIPSHIFDLDEATADRLTGLAVRRRRLATISRLGLLVSSIALAGIAVASTI